MKHPEIDKFITFLLQNKSLEQYLYNLSNPDSFNYEIKNIDEAIDCFIWETTPEGRDFWNEIHYSWKEQNYNFAIYREELLEYLRDLGD